jgi:hypothetical protein
MAAALFSGGVGNAQAWTRTAPDIVRAECANATLVFSLNTNAGKPTYWAVLRDGFNTGLRFKFTSPQLSSGVVVVPWTCQANEVIRVLNRKGTSFDDQTVSLV